MFVYVRKLSQQYYLDIKKKHLETRCSNITKMRQIDENFTDLAEFESKKALSDLRALEVVEPVASEDIENAVLKNLCT